MMYKEKIRQLCQERTDLSDEDIEMLISKATDLLENKDFQDHDVFIDVKNIYSDNAVVIFHKKPNEESSLYEQEVVGEIAILENEPGVIRTLETGLPSIGFSAVSQEGLSIHQRVFPITRDKRVIGSLIIESDSSKSFPHRFSLTMRNEGDNYQISELSTVDDRLSFMEYIDVAILVFDDKGYLIYCNPASSSLYKQQLGYKDSLLGMHYDNLILDSTMFDELDFSPSKHRQSSELVPYSSYFFSIRKQLLADGLMMVTYKDVTDEQQKEVALNMEKDAVREANHRVKNNLQSIISLLRLQMGQYETLETKKALQDCMNRIFSISIVHETLSKKRKGKVSVSKLVAQVIHNVQICFSGRFPIELDYHVDSGIYLDTDRATAVALIVNELLQNSYDHAFVRKKIKKKAKINLQITKDYDIIRVQVSDNGSGYMIGGSNKNHLGLTLVDSFVRSKLFGKKKVHSSSKGTTTQISFKE